MKNNLSPSVNIIRDNSLDIDYLVTPNANKTANAIFENFDQGSHAFNLIGSFGTGKSAFFWALEKTLKGEKEYFKTIYNGQVEFVKIIGEYSSLKTALQQEFNAPQDIEDNSQLFDSIFQRYEKLQSQNSLLVIAIDEFGKFLEYAAKNSSEEEIYFIQSLAEFVNSPKRNILLLTSIHQSFESYGYKLSEKNLNEWKKVKGRFKDLTFNEPVEQLLFLAIAYLRKNSVNIEENEVKGDAKLILDYNLFSLNSDYLSKEENQLSPLTAISGYTLALALQRYGQNERSLFTFLKSVKFQEIEGDETEFGLADIYDYLFTEFYQLIISKSNPDYSNWTAIKDALERSETVENLNIEIAGKFLKSLGLLAIFSKKGSKLNTSFFVNYFQHSYSGKEVESTIEFLRKVKIIRFTSFDDSFKLFDGTDLDIEKAISDAEQRIDSSLDQLTQLNSHFDFPLITAKAVTYQLGTPRLFEFELTNEPTVTIPEGEIDGVINLIFTENQIDEQEIITYSRNKAVMFGYFQNTTGIFETLFEIEKTKKVLKDMKDENDRVAIKELQSIIKSQEALLSHFVLDSIYSDKVEWYANGNKFKIKNKRDFNKALSNLCLEIYRATPRINNELFNRHKVSAAISTARRNYWRALVNNYEQEDLGFDANKWPAEKTIYFTLLKETGIHYKKGESYSLREPQTEDFALLWEISNNFLNDAKTSKKSIVSFIERLSEAPLKLKQGVIDFWVPTFLFLKRGDFALYGDQGFIPYLEDNTLYMMTRNPKEYYVKSFELNNLRLNLFNKYRDFLQQENKESLDTDSFIESIRPLLIFYRDLTDYGKTTKTISVEAVKLRTAISKAKDPEKTFFEDIPEALGFSLNELASNNKLFDEYIIEFQEKIEEIKASFTDLLNRFEIFISNEIINQRVDFPEYKNILKERFESVKEHEALAKHKMLLWRINSNLDDRDSFLMSLGQALIGKGLNKIKDSDEKLLKEKLLTNVRELDNLVDLNKVAINENEELFKLDLTSKEEGGKSQIIRFPKNQSAEMENILREISKQLDGHKNLKMPILVSLLKRELEKNE